MAKDKKNINSSESKGKKRKSNKGKATLKKLSIVWTYLVRHKYLMAGIIGTILVGLVGENSIRNYLNLQMQLSDVKAELEGYEQQFERDSIRLRSLNASRKGVERIARERYYMKRPNEEIFVLTSDEKLIDSNKEE